MSYCPFSVREQGTKPAKRERTIMTDSGLFSGSYRFSLYRVWAKFPLITRRSHVQIVPPQPILTDTQGLSATSAESPFSVWEDLGKKSLFHYQFPASPVPKTSPSFSAAAHWRTSTISPSRRSTASASSSTWFETVLETKSRCP